MALTVMCSVVLHAQPSEVELNGYQTGVAQVSRLLDWVLVYHKSSPAMKASKAYIQFGTCLSKTCYTHEETRDRRDKADRRERITNGVARSAVIQVTRSEDERSDDQRDPGVATWEQELFGFFFMIEEESAPIRRDHKQVRWMERQTTFKRFGLWSRGVLGLSPRRNQQVQAMLYQLLDDSTEQELFDDGNEEVDCKQSHEVLWNVSMSLWSRERKGCIVSCLRKGEARLIWGDRKLIDTTWNSMNSSRKAYWQHRQCHTDGCGYSDLLLLLFFRKPLFDWLGWFTKRNKTAMFRR